MDRSEIEMYAGHLFFADRKSTIEIVDGTFSVCKNLKNLSNCCVQVEILLTHTNTKHMYVDAVATAKFVILDAIG